MTYMAMRDPEKYTGMAKEYFGPSKIVDVPAMRRERTLATANVAPGPVAPGQYDYTAGMSKGTGEFASLADRQATMNQMAPYMKSQVEQAPAPSLAPVVTPFSNQGAQMDTLRAARPGRMPRKMSRTPGGGGLGL